MTTATTAAASPSSVPRAECTRDEECGWAALCEAGRCLHQPGHVRLTRVYLRWAPATWGTRGEDTVDTWRTRGEDTLVTVTTRLSGQRTYSANTCQFHAELEDTGSLAGAVVGFTDQESLQDCWLVTHRTV